MKKYPHSPQCRCRKDPEAWWVNAPAYHNCLWVYLRHNTRPHTLLEISKLLNLSISAVTAIEKKALDKLKKRISGLILKK